jgi:sulfur carrier protein ThiS adenylyltransferase
MVNYEAFENHLIERHGKANHDKVKGATVGIAGLGGLGSNIALSLARLGVGRLILVDFDRVELSNVNRQAYFIDHIGMVKVEALRALIQKVNPFVTVETHEARVTRDNVVSLFQGVDVLVEAFDQPISKAELSETILTKTKIPLVAASGMAGPHSSNSIVTRKIRKGFYLCGDGVSDISSGESLMAPRVAIAAGHQANMVLRLLIGEEEV